MYVTEQKRKCVHDSPLYSPGDDRGEYDRVPRRRDGSRLRQKPIQIVIISRLAAYGKFAPYSFVQSEEELKEAVRAM